ncbi:hypothetical protein MKEN_01018700 [Mycena kentingensis (nom. inval.)]|nr:hypothetical protein MKEN_01018700 [Mycena kentingensis (nom. inval.)]
MPPAHSDECSSNAVVRAQEQPQLKSQPARNSRRVQWESVQDDFNTLRYGDLFLLETHRMADSFYVARGAVKRGVHSVRVGSQSLTAISYSGESAEETERQWIQELALYSTTVRHPSLLQLWGTSSFGGTRYTIFHGELVPVALITERFERDLVVGVHLSACVFIDLQILFHEYPTALCLTTGRLCVDPFSLPQHRELGLWPVYEDIAQIQNLLPRPRLDVRSIDTSDGLQGSNASDTLTFESLTLAMGYLSHEADVGFTLRNYCRAMRDLGAPLPLLWIELHREDHGTLDRDAGHILVASLDAGAQIPCVYEMDGDETHWQLQGRNGPWNRFRLRAGDRKTASIQLDRKIPGGWRTSSEFFCSQANYIKQAVEAVVEHRPDYHYSVVDRVRVQLQFTLVAPLSKSRALYLFIRNAEDVFMDLPRCDECMYWSYDPQGQVRADESLCPWKMVLVEPLVRQRWYQPAFEVLAEYSRLRGFDPASLDLAYSLGHPILQLEQAFSKPLATVLQNPGNRLKITASAYGNIEGSDVSGGGQLFNIVAGSGASNTFNNCNFGSELG